MDVDFWIKTRWPQCIINDDNQDREDRLNYLDQYSCRPPPFFLLALSFAQVVAVIMMVVDDNDNDSTDRGLCLPCLNPDQPRQRRRSQWSGLYEGSNTPLIYAIRPTWSLFLFGKRRFFLRCDFVGLYNMNSLSQGPPDLQPAKEERDLAVFDLPVCSQRILSHLLQHTRPGAVLYQPSTPPSLSW